jgi:hypothetical protein
MKLGTEKSRKNCPNKHLVLRQESEGEVTQGKTAGFDRCDRILPGEPFREQRVASVSIVLLQNLPYSFRERGMRNISLLGLNEIS